MFCAALNEKFNLGSQRCPIKNDSGALAALSKRLSTFVSSFCGGRDIIYCAEVPGNTRVFTGRPTRATRPAKIKQHTRAVSELAAGITSDAKRKATEVPLREGENGMLLARVWRQRIWVWPEDQAQPKELWLLVRQMSEGELKTSVSNAGESTPLKRRAQ